MKIFRNRNYLNGCYIEWYIKTVDIKRYKILLSILCTYVCILKGTRQGEKGYCCDGYFLTNA